MNLFGGSKRLEGPQRWLRLALLAGVIMLSTGLRGIDPASVAWFPLRPSCGAITGLPCIFCGVTRALHHLLNGHFRQALYFNWLAFPVAAFALLLAAKLGAELVLRRPLSLPLPAFGFTPRFAVVGAGVLLTLWALQVSLTLSLHKHELLNPDGLLYLLLVR